MATSSASAHDFEVDGIYYNELSETTCEVTCSMFLEGSYSGAVSIPATVSYEGKTYTVTSIGHDAFYNCTDLTSVEIPNSVTSIGVNAFPFCSSLTSIEIPTSVTSIEYSAFQDCTGLTSVDIPGSVTSIANSVFVGCTGLSSFTGKYASEDNRCLIVDDTLIAFAPSGLTSYSIPTSVKCIGIGAFEVCRNLTSIEIPSSVTSILRNAFSGCNSLTSIKIPNSVTSLNNNVFGGCNSLTSVEIPNSVTSIGEFSFGGCYRLTSIEIPTSVRSIGNMAFFDCSGLTSLDIPYRVNTIGKYAFIGCEGLTSITVNSDDPTKINLGEDVFSRVPTSTCILYVPEGSEELYAVAPQWRDFLNIEEGITGIEEITESDLKDDASYYDLHGRRVVNPATGIYIHNSKKEVMKY